MASALVQSLNVRPVKAPQAVAIRTSRVASRAPLSLRAPSSTVLRAADLAVEEATSADTSSDDDAAVAAVDDVPAQDEEVDVSATQSDWAKEELAKLMNEDREIAEDPSYSLNFLWMEKNVAVAVDQIFGADQRSPVTEYFFWPRRDAWEELKAGLEAKPWISEKDKVMLLNKTTEVINYWQDETKHTLAEVQSTFPDCKFQGS